MTRRDGAAHERRAATNAWAFRLWLRLARGVAIEDWDTLHAFSLTDAFAAALAAFVPGAEGSPRAIASSLLHRDLRPDDVVLTADGLAWPGSAGLGTWLRDEGPAEELFARASEWGATMIALPAEILVRVQPALSAGKLRQVVALGGPCPPMPPGVVRLGCAGTCVWGNPWAPDGAPASALCVRPPPDANRDER